MRNILGYVGLLLEIFSAFLILPLIVAFYYGESPNPFFTLLIISLFLGVILDKSFKRETLRLKEGFVLTAALFFFISALGAIPFLFVFEGPAGTVLINAIFESSSGFTTTGLTTILLVEEMPKSILFWRAEMQWLGGMGIIIVFLSIFNRLRTSSSSLYSAQGYTDKIEPTIHYTTIRMLKIYSVYSVLGVILLFLTGLSFFEAVSTTFTAISTGGFTVVDNFYTSSYTLAVVSLLMIIGSISFFLHDKLFRKRLREFMGNVEIKSFFLILLVLVPSVYFITADLKVSVFELISALTATGYSITPVSALPFMVLILIIMAMFIGSSSGSTAGGIKQLRFVIMMKSLPWTFKRLTSPERAVIPFRAGSNVLEKDAIRLAGIFIFAYAGLLVLTSLMLVMLGYSPVEALFEVSSAQGTVGLSVIDLYAAPALVKLILMANMFFGRLEIFPVIILIRTIITRG